MGTRHLTAVVMNKKVVVAQYGQWDGYPSGQGSTVTDFIKDRLMKKFAKGTGLDKFKKALKECRFLSTEEIKKSWTDSGASPDSDMVTMDIADRHKASYPGLSRDTGAEVLGLIYAGEVTGLMNSWDFGADSLFCEYAYVLDLDNKVLEVYKGFNTSGKTKGRFAKVKTEGGNPKYGGVTLFEKIDFKDCGPKAIKALEKKIEKFYEDQEAKEKKEKSATP